MRNGLTPMGKCHSRETSDRLKLWHKNTLEAAKLVKPALFSVLTIDSEWMKKGYINSRGEMGFDNEHDAIAYLDNWYKSNKGYARIISRG